MALKVYFMAHVGMALLLGGCASGGGSGEELSSNFGGSEALNPKEEVEYKKALLRCYKTGGNRIVKIEGQLRCY